MTVSVPVDGLNAKDKMETARIKLLFDWAWWGMPACKLRLRETRHLPDGVPTAVSARIGLDAESLFYNPDHVDKLTKEEAVGAFAHEICHVILLHAFRCQTRHMMIWNYACDFVINGMLVKAGLTMLKHTLIDTRFDGMTEEQVYDFIINELQTKGYFGDGEGKGVPVSIPGGKGVIEKGLEDTYGPPSCDGMHPGEKSDDFSTEKSLVGMTEQDAKALAAEAIMMSKTRGDEPGAFESMIDALLAPRMDWRRYLSRFFTDVMAGDYSHRRPDRRYEVMGIPGVPSLDDEPTADGVAVFDSSGSMTDDELQEHLGDFRAILQDSGIKSCRVMICDTEVHYDETLTPDDLPPEKFPGRGGTSFTEPFRILEEEGVKPSFLIYFTDSFGLFPDDEPKYPVIWVYKDRGFEEVEFPWGEVIALE